jgi:hypothetical protein
VNFIPIILLALIVIVQLSINFLYGVISGLFKRIVAAQFPDGLCPLCFSESVFNSGHMTYPGAISIIPVEMHFIN